MRIAVSLQSMFAGLPFYERFARARHFGFDLVEIGDWTELDLSRVAQELAFHSLRLVALTGADRFSLTDPAARGEFLEYLSQSVAVAKSFGCRNLVIQSADPDNEPPPPSDPTESVDFNGRAAAADALIQASEKAARAGVTLFLKPAALRGTGFSYLHTNSSAGSLVKVINSSALRLLFTFSLSHPIEDSVAATFSRYRGHIGYVHIGEANLRVIKAVLADGLGYDGIVGLVSSSGDDEARVEEIKEVFGKQ